MTSRARVERSQVESSLRDLFGEGEAAARQYAGVTAGAAGAQVAGVRTSFVQGIGGMFGAAGALGFLAMVFAFLIGRRKGRRRSAVVEIRSR